jgi:uncharacterized protein (TIGR03435 family)
MDIEPGAGPASIWTRRYDIQAKIPSETPANQVPAMLRKLLAERFQLVVHDVTGEREVYRLVVAKGGLKMRQTGPTHVSGKNDCSLTIMPKPGVGVRVVAKGYTMRSVAESLAYRLQTPVVDKTGAEGAFAFIVEYSPPNSRMQWDLRLGPFVGALYPEPSTPPRLPPYPSIPIALEEQLGLRLERHVTSLDVLVVDRVNAPAERR